MNIKLELNELNLKKNVFFLQNMFQLRTNLIKLRHKYKVKYLINEFETGFFLVRKVFCCTIIGKMLSYLLGHA